MYEYEKIMLIIEKVPIKSDKMLMDFENLYLYIPCE